MGGAAGQEGRNKSPLMDTCMPDHPRPGGAWNLCMEVSSSLTSPARSYTFERPLPHLVVCVFRQATEGNKEAVWAPLKLREEGLMSEVVVLPGI